MGCGSFVDGNFVAYEMRPIMYMKIIFLGTASVDTNINALFSFSEFLLRLNFNYTCTPCRSIKLTCHSLVNRKLQTYQYH